VNRWAGAAPALSARLSAGLLAGLVLVATATACGGQDDDALVVDEGMAVLDAWTRPSPPTVDEAAIYVTVENRDAPDDRLIGASSDRCVVVTPHLTEFDDDDVARMTAAGGDQLGLRAGERVEMTPIGLHLMCLGLVEPFAEGDRFDVTLQFSERAPMTVAVSVEQR
jgi:copper(I)-binding protein